ncbi:Uncharacterised protein [uncultured archaeon]|nr:Uncharacterised protein [uncultured archaeon]
MAKELPKLCSYNMRDGRIYVGICDGIDWENKNIQLKEASLFLLKRWWIGKENYTEKIKNCHEKFGERNNYLVQIDEINSAYILY